MPVFVLDPRLLGGRFPSANRAWFLHGCLAELREALRERGADLVIREGRPEEELPALARECGAEAVYFAGDVSPFARARDRRVAEVLDARPQPGLFIADDLGARQAVLGLHPVLAGVAAAAAPRGPRRAARAELPERARGRAPARRAGAGGARPLPARRARRARAGEPLVRRRPRPLRGAPRPARGRDVAALALPALRLHLAARARGARARARRRGVRPPARVARLLRARPPPQPGQHAPRPQGPSTTGSSGTTTRSCSTPGARAAPAIRSSTPRCASCSTRAGCTTAAG